MNKNTCLVGLQYGDEGKGSISQYLSYNYEVFVRYQGGGNAGHTIYKDGKKIVTHFLPVGVARGKDSMGNDPICILANGMVINPISLVQEVKDVSNAIGVSPESLVKNIFISNKAHVITEKAIEKDRQREELQKIGTTKTGIGPTYESKYNRTGLTVSEALSNPEYKEFVEMFSSNIVNTEILLNELNDENYRIFFEGAQGALLDVDFGQYPYVTSSNCIPSAIGTGAGFSPRKIVLNIGVIKPYTTRVGAGPFPTEMSKEEDEAFRLKGDEWGATTGRPRKCGWLDIPSLRYAIQLADIDEIAVSKMDMLDGVEEIKVCVGYSLDGSYVDGISDFPTGKEWDKVSPLYESWPTNKFLESLQEYLDIKIRITSWGPNIEDKVFIRSGSKTDLAMSMRNKSDKV